MFDHAETVTSGSVSTEPPLSQRGERCSGWGRAYRNGQLVCAHVRITIGHDNRLGLTRDERRYVIARFQDDLEKGLRSELVRLVRRRGAAARRVADSLETIELVLDEPRAERPRIIGRLQSPQLRHGQLRDIEFGLRELEPNAMGEGIIDA
jgi:hypothetical protein